MTEDFMSSANFVADTLMNLSPEQAILTGANVAITALAYVGVRVSPRLALAVGSVIYGGLHVLGWAVKSREPSPACKAALDALDDDAAVYEEIEHGMTGAKLKRLTCTGLVANFKGCKHVSSLWLPGVDLADVLAGGADGREYRKVVAKALAKRAEVMERDRRVANEAAAAGVAAAKSRAIGAAGCVEQVATNSTAWKKPQQLPAPPKYTH